MEKNQNKSFQIFNYCKAFALAEVMIVLSVIGIVAVATIGITHTKANNFTNQYMTYSAFTNLKEGVGALLNAGCTSGVSTVCPVQGASALPIVGHDAAATPLGLCDRLASEVFNAVGTVNCALTTTSGFNAANANFITTNGMRFYNFGNNSPLSNSVNGATVYTYKVFIDIDGAGGSSTLNKDVLPFIIRTDGLVLPYRVSGTAFSVNGASASDNVNYLSASVGYRTGSGSYNVFENGVGYAEAYCDANGSYWSYNSGTSVYLNDTTCTGYQSPCDNVTTFCTVKLLKPKGIK